MKKLLSSLLALALALTLLAGCSADGAASASQPAATPEPTPTPEPYTPEVLTGLKAAGLTPIEVKEKRGWVCIICKKSDEKEA